MSAPLPRPAQPSAGQLVALADQCVQCGLCLPACPTYSLDRLEAESARGRIALARAWALAPEAATPAGETHLDQCLGCRRCEAVCPAGVRYGPLLVAARAQQRDRRPPGWRLRAIELVAGMPRVLAALLGLYRLAWPMLPPRLRPLPRPPRAPAARQVPQAVQVARVALFSGCVARPYEAGLRRAVARLCAPLGFDSEVPPGQGCCGTLHAHAGDLRTAGHMARRNRDAFAGYGQVLTLASGCHETVVDALGPGVVEDAAAFLARQPTRLRFRETRERVALHLPCTQQSVVRSGQATRQLLSGVPGLDIVVLDAGHGCCGAAGTRMVDDPDRAAAFRAPLLAQFAASGATRLLSANIGCRLHLANGTTLPVQHPLEFLAECLDATVRA